MERTKPKPKINHQMKMLAWELTQACNLRCAHCRASAEKDSDPDLCNERQCLSIIDQIAASFTPVIILTGGEPLLRDDFFDIANYATSKGLRVVIGTNGTTITSVVASKIKSSGVKAVGISLDYPEASLQDAFRGVNGAFDKAIEGITNSRNEGIPVQINSTISLLNVNYLERLLQLALDVGASAFHPFLLVPTGRGENLKEVELSADEYEKVLNWVYDKQIEYKDKLFIKPTDAPHYMRIVSQRNRTKPDGIFKMLCNRSVSRGCLAGTGFCFISHMGSVHGCGYLKVPAGDLSKRSLKDIWENSTLFNDLRDISKLKGKCGACEYKVVCGGCRARAYEATGDYLEAEPYCLYQPSGCKSGL